MPHLGCTGGRGKGHDIFSDTKKTIERHQNDFRVIREAFVSLTTSLLPANVQRHNRALRAHPQSSACIESSCHPSDASALWVLEVGL